MSTDDAHHLDGPRLGCTHAGHTSDARCVLTVEDEPLDLVIEGTAVKVRDQDTLGRVAQAYDAVYGWQVTVRDGALDAAGVASTAGPPPYDVYRVATAYGFGAGVGELVVSTRWRFPQLDDRAAER